MKPHPIIRPLGLASFLLFTGCAEPEQRPFANSLSLTCASSSVPAGETVQCTASALDQNGQPLPVAPQFIWGISSEGDIATVDQEGKVSTLGPGSARVHVVPAGYGYGPALDAFTTLTVLEDARPRLAAVTAMCERTPLLVGKTLRCTASATDQLGAPFPITRATWASNNESVAKVDADGNVSILALGTANLTVTATGGNITRQGALPLQIKAPTEHRLPITASQTWRRADNPHLVSTTLPVGSPQDPILTLEPGVDVVFEAGAALMIGIDEQNPGTLRANGSEQAPILFSARSATPQPGHWAGVYFLRTSTALSSRLHHTILEYAGTTLKEMTPLPGIQSFTGALVILGNPAAAERGTRITLDHVEVRESKEYGFVLGATLSAGSARLSAHDNGKAGLVAAPNAVGSIPVDSQFTDNAANEILVWGGEVTEGQTWPRLNVPYRLTSLLDSLPAVISVGSSAYPTLRLEAGTRLLMPAGSAFFMGLSEPGRLVAAGNENEPVQFMADTPSPTPGFWSGLHFMEAENSSLAHVHVSHAGSKLYDLLGGGAVNVYQELGPLLRNSTLRDSGCGVSVAAQGVTTDFTRPEYGNVFLDLADASQCTQ